MYYEYGAHVLCWKQISHLHVLCWKQISHLWEEERKSKRKVVPPKLAYISFFLPISIILYITSL